MKNLFERLRRLEKRMVPVGPAAVFVMAPPPGIVGKNVDLTQFSPASNGRPGCLVEFRRP